MFNVGVEEALKSSLLAISFSCNWSVPSVTAIRRRHHVSWPLSCELMRVAPSDQTDNCGSVTLESF